MPYKIFYTALKFKSGCRIFGITCSFTWLIRMNGEWLTTQRCATNIILLLLVPW